jgi:hypothetical protein
MNNQQLVFTEIIEGVTLFFFAALLIGFSIAVLRIIYMLISDFLAIHKLKKPLDYEKEAQELIRKLSVHKDVKDLDVYESDQDNHWEYYYRILGTYKGVKFLIYINKGHETAREISLIKRISKDLQEIQTFLKTITTLTFTLS